MKTTLRIIVALALTIGSLAHTTAQNRDQITLTTTSVETTPVGTIEVNGRGEIMVEPDEFNITILLDVISTKESWSIAETEMFRALSKIGINRSEIRMDDLSSATERRRSTMTSARYRVTLNSAAAVKECFEALNQIGVTQVEITSISNSEIEKHQSKARELAVKDAISKAEELAEALSLSVGRCTSIREHANYNNYYPQPIMMRATNHGGATTSSDMSEPLEFTKIKIQCSVDATFQSLLR